MRVLRPATCAAVILGGATLAGGVAAGPIHHPRPKDSPSEANCSSLPWGMYSYKQLVAAGCPMDPEWLNPDPSLPPCHDDLDWKGFATAEEAEAAIERSPEEPTCSLVTDPNERSLDD